MIGVYGVGGSTGTSRNIVDFGLCRTFVWVQWQTACVQPCFKNVANIKLMVCAELSSGCSVKLRVRNPAFKWLQESSKHNSLLSVANCLRSTLLQKCCEHQINGLRRTFVWVQCQTARAQPCLQMAAGIESSPRQKFRHKYLMFFYQGPVVSVAGRFPWGNFVVKNNPAVG